MNKKISRGELSEVVSQETTLSQNVVDAFVAQLFNEIKNEITTNSFIKVEGLGLFRVIKSGDTKRILFLGANKEIKNSIDTTLLKKELSEGDQLSTNDYQPEDYSTDTYLSETGISQNILLPSITKSKRKLNLVKTCVISLIILIIITISYFAINPMNGQKHKELNINFIQLINTDPDNYSQIVLTDTTVSLQVISKFYYGDEVFWPYIYMANKDIIRNILEIQAGSIIRIPKFEVDLAELQNGNAALKAKQLGDKIREKQTQ